MLSRELSSIEAKWDIVFGFYILAVSVEGAVTRRLAFVSDIGLYWMFMFWLFVSILSFSSTILDIFINKGWINIHSPSILSGQGDVIWFSEFNTSIRYKFKSRYGSPYLWYKYKCRVGYKYLWSISIPLSSSLSHSPKTWGSYGNRSFQEEDKFLMNLHVKEDREGLLFFFIKSFEKRTS